MEGKRWASWASQIVSPKRNFRSTFLQSSGPPPNPKLCVSRASLDEIEVRFLGSKMDIPAWARLFLPQEPDLPDAARDLISSRFSKSIQTNKMSVYSFLLAVFKSSPMNGRPTTNIGQYVWTKAERFLSFYGLHTPRKRCFDSERVLRVFFGSMTEELFGKMVEKLFTQVELSRELRVEQALNMSSEWLLVLL